MAGKTARKAKEGRGDIPALPATVKLRALTSIAGFDYSARMGGYFEAPVSEAEVMVEREVAEYALPPVEAAVKLLKDRGCGVALPKNPDDEVQAAVLAQDCPTADL